MCPFFWSPFTHVPTFCSNNSIIPRIPALCSRHGIIKIDLVAFPTNPIYGDKTKRYSTTLLLFFFPTFFSPTKDKGLCSSSAYGQNNIVLVCIQNMVRIVLVYVPGAHHTYILYVSFSYIVQGMYYRIYLRNNKRANKKMAYCAWHHLRGQMMARHPFLLDFSILGNIVANFMLHTKGTPIFFGTKLVIRLWTSHKVVP